MRLCCSAGASEEAKPGPRTPSPLPRGSLIRVCGVAAADEVGVVGRVRTPEGEKV